MKSIKVEIENLFTDVEEVIKLIIEKHFLIVAGSSNLIEKLPKGNWIAGSTPYFMTEDGGVKDKERGLFVQRISGYSGIEPTIQVYNKASISNIAADAPQNGFSVLIIPSNSDVHLNYAKDAPHYQNMFFSPITGWISGFDLDDLDNAQAITAHGPSRNISPSDAVVMHVTIPDTQMANIHIVNLFELGTGPEIEFPETSFEVDKCTIDGVTQNISDYILSSEIDQRLPLVADYNGLKVNVSIQTVENDNVKLFAPVFSGVKYRFAKTITDYQGQLGTQISEINSTGSTNLDDGLGCNCILNYLYSDLEGKSTGSLTGPIAFGEIGYQLLNQTLVQLTLDEI